MEIKFYTQVYMHINFELYIYKYIYIIIYRLFEMNIKYKKSFGYILMNQSQIFFFLMKSKFSYE